MPVSPMIIALALIVSSCGGGPADTTQTRGEETTTSTSTTTTTIGPADWEAGVIWVSDETGALLEPWFEDGDRTTYDVFPGQKLFLEYVVAGRSACDHDAVASHYQWRVTDNSNAIASDGCNNEYQVPDKPDRNLREGIWVRYNDESLGESLEEVDPIYLRFLRPEERAHHFLVDVSAGMDESFENGRRLDEALSIVEGIIASDDLPPGELVGMRVFGLSGGDAECANGTDHRLEFKARSVNRLRLPEQMNRIRSEFDPAAPGAASLRTGINAALDDLDAIPNVRDLGTYTVQVLTSELAICTEEEDEVLQGRLQEIAAFRAGEPEIGRVVVVVISAGEFPFADGAIGDYFDLLSDVRNLEVTCASLFEEQEQLESVNCPTG